MPSDPQRTFTGVSRRRKTSWTVAVGDRFAQSLVAVGGIGTIVAVLLVCVYLASQVVPLFLPAKVESTRELPAAVGMLPADAASGKQSSGAASPIRLGMDEFGTMGWGLFADGRVRCFRLDNGQILADLSPQQTGLAGMTAVALSTDGQQAVFGFADGKLQSGRISFDTRFVGPAQVPPAVREMAAGAVAEWDGGLVARTPTGQYRREKIVVKLDDPVVQGGKDQPAIRLVDRVEPASGAVFCWLADGKSGQVGKLHVASVETRHDLLSGEDVSTLSAPVELTLPANVDGPPKFLRMAGLGEYLYAAWSHGRLLRYEIRDLDHPRLMEDRNIVGESALALTAFEPLLGGATFLVGDSSGRVRAWFPIQPVESKSLGSLTVSGGARGTVPFFSATTAAVVPAEKGDSPRSGEPTAGRKGDTTRLIHGPEFAAEGSPVACIASSSSNREAAVGFADGRVRLLFITTQKTMLDLRMDERGEGRGARGEEAASARGLSPLSESSEKKGTVPFLGADLRPQESVPVESVAISPKGDRLLAASVGGATVWKFDPGYPDGTFSALFLPVWYEGEPGPKQIWQSSGTGGFEPKLGLIPLVFGTLKATFYSMIFATPLALLAALFTSEFLHPSTKARIKPTVEMMASLPSVVLGFLAGLVVAPIVSGIVPEVLTALVTIPLALLSGAYLWQLLPQALTLRFARWRFGVMLLVAIPAGALAAGAMGPLVEKYLFDGDIKSWLGSQRGTGMAGWIMLLLPLAAVVVALLIARTVNPWLRSISVNWSRRQSAVVEFLKFIAGVAATLLLVVGVAWFLDAVKIDPRGTFVGRYDERNALIVGLAMGFAIIPLIYTLADDALSSVPASLRSASLGAGATQWQTALHVVIPTAMSGLFSAVMIGLGRAVGETMIVLMAAGGQPLMDFNIFNGFQTLSAAIATQMPEAAVGTTHLRTLYVAALALFILTFGINTAAEIVRQRFRRRAYEL